MCSCPFGKGMFSGVARGVHVGSSAPNPYASIVPIAYRSRG
jgi:hypothetical protein